MLQPGRYCDQHGIPEETDLRIGMDFRRPEYRREVFLRFYDFHTRHRAHPGAVYYVFPELSRRLGWDAEQAYWFAFINGNTQNPVTTYRIWREFPTLAGLDKSRLADFLNKEWKRLEWDTDRRYWKARFWESVEQYKELLGGRTQGEFFSRFASEDEYANFDALWAAVRRDFYGFGRLSAWSYIEYLRIMGLPVAPRELYLRDIDGSKSHRNGLCKVLGRDDLEWRDGPHPYTPEILTWLEAEAKTLLGDACARTFDLTTPGADTTFLTLESTLCCYKSWHRPNRRYPNVYNDMFHDRIRRSEVAWKDSLALFWDIRRAALPVHLRLEDNAWDVGLQPIKQNHYLLTGQVVGMSVEYPCFVNDYDSVRIGEWQRRT